MSKLKTKYCKRCDRDLPLSMFTKDRKSKDGLAFYCRDCISEKGKAYRATPQGIYDLLKGRANYYKPYSIDMSKQEFLEWYTNTPKVCVYCDVPEKDLWLAKSLFGSKANRLTIDCVEPNFYHINNIVWACDRCNIVKGHQFSFQEMREIAQKYIKPHWIKMKEESAKGEKNGLE